MAKSSTEAKIYEPNYFREEPLPELIIWEEIVDRPESLADLSPTDGARLDAAETGIEEGFSDLAIQGWQFDATFSAADNDTLQWSSGTLRFKDGTSFSISGGNTGNVAALTYVYFDRAASTTVLQTTTTAANAVGANKVLIAVCQNVESGKDIDYQVFGGRGGVSKLITADAIAAGTITGNEIAANTISANKLIVSQLSAISADLGSITAGTITGALFRTATSGVRIEMDTTNINQIRFYDSTTLFGQLEAYKVGSDGYIGLIAQDDGAGFEVYTGVGASAFSSAEIFSVGGGFATSGNASNGFNTINGKFGGYFGVFGTGGGGPDYISTDLEIDSDWVPTANNSYDLGSSSKKWSTVYALTISGLTTLSVGGTASVNNLNISSVAIPRVYHGYVNGASGTTLSKANNSFSISSPGTGRFTITHNFGSTNYVVVAMALRASGSGAYATKIGDLSSNSCEVIIFDDGGTVRDSDFMFIILRP